MPLPNDFGCKELNLFHNGFLFGAHMNEFLVTLSSLVSHAGQVGVSFLAIFAHNTAVVERVLP